MTAVVASTPKVLTPTTPPAGVVALAPSAPKTSGVPSVKTLPVMLLPSLTLVVFALATGASSVIVTATVLLTKLPNVSVTA